MDKYGLVSVAAKRKGLVPPSTGRLVLDNISVVVCFLSLRINLFSFDFLSLTH